MAKNNKSQRSNLSLASQLKLKVPTMTDQTSQASTDTTVVDQTVTVVTDTTTVDTAATDTTVTTVDTPVATTDTTTATEEPQTSVDTTTTTETPVVEPETTIATTTDTSNVVADTTVVQPTETPIASNTTQAATPDTATPQVTEQSTVDNTAIQQAPVTQQQTAVAVATTPVAPVVQDTSPAAPSDFEATVAKLKSEGTGAQKATILGIEQYIDNMKPGKPLQHHDGAMHQYRFWKLISHLLETAPQEEFRKLWAILLLHAKQHSEGVFADRYVFRFAEHWSQNVAELNAFQRIINIIRLTADPEKRAAGLKQVDLNRSMEEGFTETARQRLISFYK